METATFYLYKRTRKNDVPLYHAKIKQHDGTYQSFNTGCTDKTDAATWAKNKYDELQRDYRKSLQSRPIKKPEKIIDENITFAAYAKDFFAPGNTWSIDKQVAGKRLTDRQCNEKTRILNNHIIPAIGEMSIVDIGKNEIKQFRNNLYKKGMAGSSINKCLSCISQILTYAEDEGIIDRIPSIERASDAVINPRGILTPEEVREIFSIEWSSYPAYVCCLICAACGLRLGECLALTFADVRENFISINKTWDHVSRKVKPSTKTGRPRIVIAPSKVLHEMAEIKTFNTFYRNNDNTCFIIYGRYADAPLDGKAVLKSFKKALAQIGIDERQRTQRNLTVHGFRHFFNSLMVNSKIPIAKIQTLTGHLSDEMTTGSYYHADDLKDVLQIQETIF